jgi:hypothetical protein
LFVIEHTVLAIFLKDAKMCFYLTWLKISVFEVENWIAEEPLGPVLNVDNASHFMAFCGVS